MGLNGTHEESPILTGFFSTSILLHFGLIWTVMDPKIGDQYQMVVSDIGVSKSSI